MKHTFLLLTLFLSLAGFAQSTATDNSEMNNNNAHPSTSNMKHWMDSTKTSLMAQDSARAAKMTLSNINLTDETYYIKNSKLHQFKNGQLKSIKVPVRLKNSTTITTTGLVKLNNGTTLQLKNGDAIDRDGIITKFKQ